MLTSSVPPTTPTGILAKPEIMSPAVVCEPRDSITDVMSAMTHRRVRHVPVLGNGGHMAGIVSLGDVVKHRLEEIETEASVLRDYITILR